MPLYPAKKLSHTSTASLPVVSSPSRQRVKPSVCTLPSGAKTRTPLYAHQHIGVARLIKEARKRGYFGLLDDCGLGKTIQIIYAASDLLRVGFIDKIIIVCKSDLVSNWEDEFKIHAPHLQVQTLCGIKPKKGQSAISLRKWDRRAQVYVINFDLFGIIPQNKKLKVKSAFSGRRISITMDAARMLRTLLDSKCLIAADESHRIRGVNARSTETLCTIGGAAKVRFIATATLEAETPVDVWSQIFFLDRGRLLGKSYKSFLSRYTIKETKEVWRKKFNPLTGQMQAQKIFVPTVSGLRNVKELRSNVASISLRRHIDECVDLPPRIPKTRNLSATGKQLALLGIIRDHLLKNIENVRADNIVIKKGSSTASLIHMLQRAAAMPCVIGPMWANTRSEKYEALLEVMDESTSQIVVWCYHREVTQAVVDALKKDKRYSSGVSCVMGGMNKRLKESELQEFKSGNNRTLVCTEAIAEGHNLQMASHSVVFQPAWTRLVKVQSVRRIYRIGQTRSVVFETFLMKQSLDKYQIDWVDEKEKAATYDTGGGDVLVLHKESFMTALRAW